MIVPGHPAQLAQVLDPMQQAAGLLQGCCVCCLSCFGHCCFLHVDCFVALHFGRCSRCLSKCHLDQRRKASSNALEFLLLFWRDLHVWLLCHLLWLLCWLLWRLLQLRRHGWLLRRLRPQWLLLFLPQLQLERCHCRQHDILLKADLQHFIWQVANTQAV